MAGVDQQQHSETVLDRISKNAKNVAGINLYLLPVQDLTVDAQAGKTQYQFSLQGADPTQISTWAEKIVDRLKTAPQVKNVSSDIQNDGLQAYVKLDRTARADRPLAALPIMSPATLRPGEGRRWPGCPYARR